MQRLVQKSILVAGGGLIGNELARRFAREGAAVVLGDINVKGAQSVAEEISKAGGKAIATRLDGADEQSIAQAIKLCCDTHGGLDGIHINFASFADLREDSTVLDLPLDAFDEAMRVSVRGHFLCTRLALPALLARGGGSIIYTSSMAAYWGEPAKVAYAMSKSALHGLMRHVATRYGADKVRANCIAPGAIAVQRGPGVYDHPTFGTWPDETVEMCLGLQRIKHRLGNPQDIAATAALLMADEGSFITGQIISVDGGSILRP